MHHVARRVASHRASTSTSVPPRPSRTSQLPGTPIKRTQRSAQSVEHAARAQRARLERVSPTRAAHTWPAAPRHIAPRRQRRRRFPRCRRTFRPIGRRRPRRTHSTYAYAGGRTGLPYPPPKLSGYRRRGENLWRRANRAKLSGFAVDGQISGGLLKHQFDHHTLRPRSTSPWVSKSAAVSSSIVLSTNFRVYG